ncbi:hypothetical protein [Nocardia noduli]|uniref:hypothetical protein n=1 Tax=Nocardia noduli TaxID=2815722 RepID=UPI001C2421BD|nr:hypothetical protein [Nocardia noduli]
MTQNTFTPIGTRDTVTDGHRFLSLWNAAHSGVEVAVENRYGDGEVVVLDDTQLDHMIDALTAIRTQRAATTTPRIRHHTMPIKLLQLLPRQTRAIETAAQLTNSSRHVTVTDHAAVFDMNNPPAWATATLNQLRTDPNTPDHVTSSFAEVAQRLNSIGTDGPPPEDRSPA